MDENISIAEELSKQIDLAEQADTPPETPPEVAPEQEATDAGRARDEKGRFAPKKADESQEATPEVPPQTEAITEPPPEKQKEYQRLGLRKEEFAHFEKAPPEVQGILRRRMGELREAFERSDADVKFAQTMRQTISPYEATFRAAGVDAVTAVHALLNTDHRLRYGAPHEKAQAFVKIAQTYGVDLAGLVQQAESQPKADPMVSTLQQRLSALENTLLQQYQQAAQDDERRRMDAVSQFFAAHPQAEQLQDEIVAQIAAVRQADPSLPYSEVLKQAYDKAQWASPTYRESLLAKQREETEKKARDDAAAKAAAAKKAGFDVKGQGGIGIASSSGMSLRDELSSMIPG